MPWPWCGRGACPRRPGARRPDGQLRRGRARHRNAGRHRRRQGLVQRQERPHPRRHPRQGGYSDYYLQREGANAPAWEAGDFDLISQPTDFLGLNIYTATYIRAASGAAFPAWLRGAEAARQLPACRQRLAEHDPAGHLLGPAHAVRSSTSTNRSTSPRTAAATTLSPLKRRGHRPAPPRLRAQPPA